MSESIEDEDSRLLTTLDLIQGNTAIPGNQKTGPVEEKFPRLYADRKTAAIALGLTSLSIAMIAILATVQMEHGGLWFLVFVAYVPFLVVTIWQRNCLMHIVGAPFLITFIPWVIHFSVNSPERDLLTIPGMMSCCIVMSMLLFWWSRVDDGKPLGFAWVAKMTCLLTSMSLVIVGSGGIMYGISTALYQVPFLIQPIVIFGFGGLEAVVYSVNATIALTIYSGMFEGPTQRSLMLRFAVVGTILILWCSVGSIVAAVTDPKGAIEVSAVGGSDIIADARLIVAHTQAHFVVFPEQDGIQEGSGHPEDACLDYIEKAFQKDNNPPDSFVTFGCYLGEGKKYVITIDPSGELVNLFGNEDGRMQNRVLDRIPHGILKKGDKSDDFRFMAIGSNDLNFLDTPIPENVSLVLVPSEHKEKAVGHTAAFVIAAIANRVSIVKAAADGTAAIITYDGHRIARGRGIGNTDIHATVPLTYGVGSPRIRSRAGYGVFAIGLLFVVLWGLYAWVNEIRTRRRGDSDF